MKLETIPSPLSLISAAVERGEHRCETDLTAFAAKSIALDPSLQVWCSCSSLGKSHDLRPLPNVKNSYVSTRSYDLAYGRRGEAEPSRLVQLKHDKGFHVLNPHRVDRSCLNTPFRHALRDLIYMALDFQRLGASADCFMVAVVHKDNLEKDHRWKPFLEAGEWTFVCEPSGISQTGRPKNGFVNIDGRRIQPFALGQANEIFGTKWQSLGHGLFARPGVLTVRFETQSQLIGDFGVIEWQLIDVSLQGTDVPLAAWLP